MRLFCIWSLCLVVVNISSDGYSSQNVSMSPAVQESIHQLMETNSCPSCNLAGVVLTRIDLSEANLEEANLAGAQLNLANLAGANLKNANLQGASLGGADLAGADLRGANLTGAVLEGAYLVGAQMDGEVVTRRPYVEEGGPDSGEKVFVDSEKNSKNVPFTNQAFVGPDEKSAEKIPLEEPGEERAAVPEADQSQVTVSGEMDTVPEQPGDIKPVEEVLQVEVEEETITEIEQTPEQSKKLVMIAEAVILDAPPAAGKAKEKEDVVEVAEESEESLVETLPEQPVQEPDSLKETVSIPETEAVALNTTPEEVKSEDIKEPAEVAKEPGQSSQDTTLPEQPVPAQEPVNTAALNQDAGEAVGEVPGTEKPAADNKSDAEEVGEVAAGKEVEPGEGVTLKVSKKESVPQVELKQPQLDKDVVVAELIPIDEPPAAEQESTENIKVETVEKEMEMEAVQTETMAGEPEQVKVESETSLPTEVLPALEEKAEAVTEEKVLPPDQVDELVYTVETPDTANERKNQLVEMLLDENRCVGCDLSGVDLSGKNLDEADLERANLQGANLNKADLQEANLKGAELQGANLRDADLREADLYRANLNGADLTGARLEEALVDSVSAEGAIGVNFEGALQDE